MIYTSVILKVLLIELILGKIHFLVHYLLNLMQCLLKNNDQHKHHHLHHHHYHRLLFIDEIQYLMNRILLGHLFYHNLIMVGFFVKFKTKDVLYNLIFFCSSSFDGNIFFKCINENHLGGVFSQWLGY